jgi:hypothetical protein
MGQDQTQPAGVDPRVASLGIAVVGAGSIGADLARHLGLMGFGRVDVYESDPGAAAALRGAPGVGDVHLGDFWDELTLTRLRGYDFAICAVQDPTARARMNRKCLVANVSLLQTWTEGSHAVVAAFPFGLPGECACYECDIRRASSRAPLASVRLSVDESGLGTARPGVPPTSIAGALTAALTARIATGAFGSVARRATLDTVSGAGTSVEWPRDPECALCRGLERPVPIVRTRNRWTVSTQLAESFPEALDQSVQLSDEIGDGPGRTFRVGELVERFHGGPIPAKFALTAVEGRVVCLDFEDVGDAQSPSRRSKDG